MADKKDSKKTATAANAELASQTDGKSKALGLALETIEKQFGKGAIMKLGAAQQQKS